TLTGLGQLTHPSAKAQFYAINEYAVLVKFALLSNSTVNLSFVIRDTETPPVSTPFTRTSLSATSNGK
ncbi:hypothetical protein CWB97_23185, partial [Pseudoalteromonas citrea]